MNSLLEEKRLIYGFSAVTRLCSSPMFSRPNLMCLASHHDPAWLIKLYPALSQTFLDFAYPRLFRIALIILNILIYLDSQTGGESRNFYHLLPSSLLQVLDHLDKGSISGTGKVFHRRLHCVHRLQDDGRTEERRAERTARREFPAHGIPWWLPNAMDLRVEQTNIGFVISHISSHIPYDMFDVFVGDHIFMFQVCRYSFRMLSCLFPWTFCFCWLQHVAASLRSVKHSEALNRQVSQMGGAQKDIMGIDRLGSPFSHPPTLLANAKQKPLFWKTARNTWNLKDGAKHL